MKDKKIVVLLSIVIVGLAIGWAWDNSRFPIKYKICGLGYTDCFVNAKFEDMDSCEFAAKTGGWLCDSSDPQNIKCSTPTASDTSVTSYCTE